MFLFYSLIPLIFLRAIVIPALCKFSRESYGWGFSDFILISKLYDMKETLLRDNTLQICIQMEIFGEPITSVKMTPLKIHNEGNILDALHTDLRELLNNEKQSDVQIVCGTKTFYSHKLILSGKFVFHPSPEKN